MESPAWSSVCGGNDGFRAVHRSYIAPVIAHSHVPVLNYLRGDPGSREMLVSV